MFRSIFLVVLIAVQTLIFSSCGGDETGKSKAQHLEAPFRFHRKIEVRPGLIYDLLTWGRGDQAVSGLVILRSDSTHQQYGAIAVEIAGKPVDIWDMDLDTDGNPEIVLQVQLANQLSDLYIYEFDRSGNAVPIHFPALSAKAMKGFKGKDKVYIKEGNLRRDFLFQNPIKKGAKAITRTLEYQLWNNVFYVKELKEEQKK